MEERQGLQIGQKSELRRNLPGKRKLLKSVFQKGTTSPLLLSKTSLISVGDSQNLEGIGVLVQLAGCYEPIIFQH